jgi:hypothetical protein
LAAAASAAASCHVDRDKIRVTRRALPLSDAAAAALRLSVPVMPVTPIAATDLIKRLAVTPLPRHSHREGDL